MLTLMLYVFSFRRMTEKAAAAGTSKSGSRKRSKKDGHKSEQNYPTPTVTRSSERTTSTSSAIDGQAYSKRLKELDILLPTPKASSPQSPLSDPFCDPENPIKVQFQTISHAAFKIKDGVERTPCSKSNQLSAMLGVDIFFKKEFMQLTGSFKERGARYTLMKLSKEQQKIGVIAASAGNHALALCCHGEQLGIPVTVVMPVIAPIMKVSRCRSFGANVLVQGNDICESKEIAMKIASEQGLMYVNGYDHPDILAGQGTIGLEIFEQINNIDAVIVPVGGGGLIAGMAVALKYLQPSITVIGVEGDSCPSFMKSMEAGKVTRTPPSATLADGLSVPVVGVNAFHTARNLIDKMVTVSEEHIALAILRLIEIEKAVVEGGGAVGLAALLAGELPELQGKRVVVLLCGGNIDTTVLGRCIDRGLAVDGRLIRFEACTSDRPGGMAELTSILAQCGASIKDIFHERAWLRTDVFHVRVRVICETIDWDHALELEEVLRKHYPDLIFNKEQPDPYVTAKQ